jgi:anaerobic ribonucleoside-triphosphate reductase
MSEVEKAEIKNQIAKLEAKKAATKGSKCEVYTRVTGFIRPVSQFNLGKKAEVSMRKMMKPCGCNK